MGRKLLLLDSAGAVLSAILLGIVLVRFEHLIGMPQNVLYFLSGIASVFALYSFTCYMVTSNNWRRYLKIIAISNLAYCVLTVGLIIYHLQKVTILGYAYFIAEVILVTGLALWELKTTKGQS